MSFNGRSLQRMCSGSTDNFLLKISSRSRRRTRKSPRTHALPLASFRSGVWNYWKEQGRRDLPWRRTNHPYKILVSELMLQQTQVHRVIPKYKEFLKAFPTVRHLARSHFVDVLKVWNGLGYNRRAKYLRDAAIEVVEKHGGNVPRDYQSLRALSGVGDYTARAIRVFAFNEPDILLETNIRTAYIHNFYSSILQKTAISDSEILPLAASAAEDNPPGGGRREWHWALMDYGAYLKRSGVRNNHRSAHYTRQSKFEGSFRQLRGAIIRALASSKNISGLRNHYIGKFDRALASLARDGLIVSEKGRWRIA
ncbi:A/G-specific adenine glycosylase [Candidatus Kaiserbacteria bacterium]|nr:A/G-specific adenine glycosylase [Candidatus Kaiserbacteria bacterium]